MVMSRCCLHGFGIALAGVLVAIAAQAEIGREVSLPRHLEDGEEFTTDLDALMDHGEAVFEAVWTVQEGAGRPQTKGVGDPLADPSTPLTFPRNFNRISAPEANSCAGCHNVPRSGGGGDFVANVFVLGHRLDFATFDHTDTVATRGCMDEVGNPALMQTIANSRNTLGMFGSGYIEMLARQMTTELIARRDATTPGTTVDLVAKGISFGTLARNLDGTWDTNGVHGLPAASLASGGADDPPSLVIRPFHQAGAVISLRQFTNNALNHHHGMQAGERFGAGMDPDGDGFTDELTRADVTATTLWQAQLRGDVRRDRLRLLSRAGAAARRPGLDLHRAEPVQPAGQLTAGGRSDLRARPERRKAGPAAADADQGRRAGSGLHGPQAARHHLRSRRPEP
jgi:hypothetical protein